MSAALLVAAMAAILSLPALAADDATSPDASASQQQLLGVGELDQLVAPIALYPDALLAQVLMASTYPLEVVQADRWAKANKSVTGDKLDEAMAKQDWDASVKALVATPTVLTMMNEDLDWTQKLGDAVLAQQPDVMDAIQRLRIKAQDNGKLATTKEQKVTVTEEAEKQVIVIEPASPETVYVPYYEPVVVYGAWPYPAYPPYYFPPAPGWVVGGALARGIAWGAGFAIGNAIYDGFDWRHGNINVDINKNVNINKHVNNVNVGNWQHNSYHRRGVNYDNKSVQNKFSKTKINTGDRKLDFRGRSGDQVLNVDKRPGGGERPGLGGDGNRPGAGNRPGDGNRPGGGDGTRPGGGDRPNLGGGDKKPGGANRPEQRSKPNAFDSRDGAKARDYSKRGQASLGDRKPQSMSKPKSSGASKGGSRPKAGGSGNRGGSASRGGG
ncbi:MAG: DUF3300 domain-containing protein, partial [Methyloceanibacter sp.]